MRFDKSFIRIRSRSLLEIFDLALLVLRKYPGPLLTSLFFGAIGFVLVNELITSQFVSKRFGEIEPTAYGWLILLLVITQAQVGTIFVTAFLGQAMFVEQPRFAVAFRSVWATLLGIFWAHGLVRCVLPVMALVAVANYSRSRDETAFFVVFAVILAFGGVLLKTFRPYVTEILVLERTPLRQSQPDDITFWLRSASLHRNIGSDSFSLSLLSGIFGLAILCGVYGSLCLLFELIGLIDEEQWLRLHVLWPVSLWLVAGLLSVVRFLSYIDMRIRQEGWEVELKIRAEALRLEREGF